MKNQFIAWLTFNKKYVVRFAIELTIIFCICWSIFKTPRQTTQQYQQIIDSLEHENTMIESEKKMVSEQINSHIKKNSALSNQFNNVQNKVYENRQQNTRLADTVGKFDLQLLSSFFAARYN